uniref:Uncharacterized protein n=1 Tax=Rhizophora mucronata TaxID=61149 RepID=A0A2P2QUQ6_RHIMU
MRDGLKNSCSLRSKHPQHSSNISRHNIPPRSHHPWIWSPPELDFEDRTGYLWWDSQLEVGLRMDLVQLMMEVGDMLL